MNFRLESLRDEKDLLQKDITNKLNISPSVYSEWEHNKLTIPTRRLYQLSELFEINIDYMVYLTNKKRFIKVQKDLDTNLVAIRVKEIRKELKLTMRDLAKIFNTTSSAISNYENNKYLILSPFLIKLCKLSNCSIDWVLGRSNSKYIDE